jgi:dGTPase
MEDNHMTNLYWDKLLTDKRMRNTSARGGHRNAFEQDYDRIVGSSSVRRLQDKAQVFPLQENDYIRTRLTHSIEVSAIARSLGKAVGRRIEKVDASFSRENTDELASLLQTTGLIHDLGNPPFGHYGERVIQNWFSSFLQNHDPMCFLSDNERKDYLNFDGNVQNIRIISKLQMLNDQNGANFTFPTISTLIKYPWSSKHAKDRKNKYGFYQSEIDLISKVWGETGLSENVRHPATFLLEAADDITYICDDIEDGVKKSLIDWNSEYEELSSKIKSPFFNDLVTRYNDLCKSTIPVTDARDKVVIKAVNFRNVAQGFMINQVIENFMGKYEEIMKGDLGSTELLDIGEIANLKVHLKKLAQDNCFPCNEVLTLELIGDTVIKGLLNFFIPAILQYNCSDSYKSYEGKLYNRLSQNFKLIARYDYKNDAIRDFSEISQYEKIQLIVDNVSGMTDTYAYNIFRELTGSKLPRWR